MTQLLIKNGLVLQATHTLVHADVRVVDGRVAEIGRALAGENVLDAGGAYVLPGLIDLHTHGIGFESCDSETLHTYAQLEAAEGATTFFPTLFTAPDKAIAQMQRHRQATNDLRDLPQVGGFRLESPYLGYAGGGLNKDLAPITPQTTHALLDAGGGHIKIWDFSPELPGAVASHWRTVQNGHRLQHGAHPGDHRTGTRRRGCRAAAYHALLRHVRPA